MTTKEKLAFKQGVEEGFVKAAELSSEPEKILRQFRPVNPTFKTRKNRLLHPVETEQDGRKCVK